MLARAQNWTTWSLVIFILLPGCGSRRPCQEGGDVSWVNPIRGDRMCYQKKLPDGRYVNDGKYVQKHLNGKVAIEGEFRDGQKHGYWFQYDETGKKIMERYFENGVEKSLVKSGAP